MRLEACTDADYAWQLWIGDQLRAIAYCTFMGGNLVTWKSKKNCGIKI